MYILYNSFGFRGIYIFTLIMASLIAIVLFNILIKRKNGLVFSFIVSLITMYLAKGVFAARNQIFSFLIFELEVYCLNEFLENNKKRYFWMLLLLAVALLLVHDTVYPLFFVIILPYIADFLLSKMFKVDSSSKVEFSKLYNMKYLIILIILCLIIGLFTPIFGTAYTNLVNCMSGFSADFINELQPVNLIENYSLTFFTFFTIAVICFTNTKVNVKDLLFTFGFLIFSLMTRRNMIFMYLIGIVFFTNIFKSFIDTYITGNILNKLDNYKLFITVISCVILIVSIRNIANNFTKEYVNDLIYPKEATSWIKKNVDYENIRIWNHFNWGSYLELNGIKVFLDSRSGMYTQEENKDCTVLRDWYTVNTGADKYNKIFEKYKITHVLLENNEITNKYICDDKNYEMIYQDNQFTLYERTNNDKN